MKTVILTSNQLRHRFFINYLAKRHNIAGVVIETKKRDPAKKQWPEELAGEVLAYFAERTEKEKEFFSQFQEISLPQEKILDIGKKYYEEAIESSRTQNDECIDLLKREGLQIIHSGDTEMNLKFVSEIGRKTREGLVGKLYSRELLERTMALLEEYRKDHPSSPVEKLK